MKVFRFGGPEIPAFRAPIVTIGNFDGVHLGHQALLRELVIRAAAAGVDGVAVTFDPHPASALQQHAEPFILTTMEEKAELMAASGLAGLMVCHFDAAFAALPPLDFLNRVILDTLTPSRILVGGDFRFGSARGAGVDELREWSAGQAVVEVIEKVALSGRVISSTCVRRALAAGDLAAVAGLLGRRFGITGRVIGGDQLGRTLGFPTANLDPGGRLLPSAGVYATWVSLAGVKHQGATYIGTRPTFNGKRLVVETYLLDAPPVDLYGQLLTLEFVRWIRADIRFASATGLEQQIAADLIAIRDALAEGPDNVSR